MDVGLPPPAAGYQDIDSGEADDDILDKDLISNEVSGEVEVHEEEAVGTIENERTQRGRKIERLRLQTYCAPLRVAEDHCDKEPYETFSKFFGPEIIQHIIGKKYIYDDRDKNT